MLCVFTGIMANYILCNFAHAVDATGQEHEHPYGHDHHHDGSMPLAEHEHKDKGHDYGEGCCNDFTYSFFSTLERSNTSTFNLNINISAIALTLPIFISSEAEKNRFYGVNVKLPPKHPDIRLFIESFQV